MIKNSIAYIDTDRLSREFFLDRVDKNYIAETAGFNNAVEAVRYINRKKELKFIIVKLSKYSTNLNKLLKLILSMRRRFLLIFIKEPTINIGHLPKTKYLKYEFVENTDKLKLDDIFFKNGIFKIDGFDFKFKKVQVLDLQRFDIFEFEIYIRLNPNKYIKIINAKAIEGREVLGKFKDKGVKHIFVRKDQYEYYLEQLYEDVASMYEYDFISENVKIDAQLSAVEYVYKVMQHMGIGFAAMEVANKTMNSVLSGFKQKRKMWDLLSKKINESSYLTYHSLAMAYLTCAVAFELGWNTRATLEKLVMASFLHDIGLEDEELSIINSKKSAEFDVLNQKEIEEVINHPVKSVDLIKSLVDLPPNVENIILDHHERPGGKGFPNSKSVGRLAPLSCLFIICEVFWNDLSRVENSSGNRTKIIELLSKHFNQGNFRKPLAALMKIVC